MPTYRTKIATALLAASTLLPIAGCGTNQRTGHPSTSATVTPTHSISTSTISTVGTDADRYSRVCRTPTEDAPIPPHCKLDPAQHYDYDGPTHAWRATNRASAPTGKELQP